MKKYKLQPWIKVPLDFIIGFFSKGLNLFSLFLLVFCMFFTIVFCVYLPMALSNYYNNWFLLSYILTFGVVYYVCKNMLKLSEHVMSNLFE